jgi:hypothetical protein
MLGCQHANTAVAISPAWQQQLLLCVAVLKGQVCDDLHVL